MNHASGTVAPLDPEVIQVGDAIGQPAQRRGLVQGSVRPGGVAEVLVFTQLWVPITSSTSCDQAIFVDHATDVSLSSDAVPVEVDGVG
jgi:hypothetical protein